MFGQHANDNNMDDPTRWNAYARMMEEYEQAGDGIDPMFVRDEYLTPDEAAARDAADDAEGLEANRLWLDRIEAEEAMRHR